MKLAHKVVKVLQGVLKGVPGYYGLLLYDTCRHGLLNEYVDKGASCYSEALGVEAECCNGVGVHSYYDGYAPGVRVKAHRYTFL